MKKGFTLIELLVVIAIIALLMAIIMPSLRAAKELASGAVCVSNQRQLCTAWTTYATENDEMLVGGSNYYSGSGGTPYRWVERPLYNDTDNPEDHPGNVASISDYSLETRKNGIRAGKLFAYTDDEDVYHCPGDRNITKSEPDAVFRSYAITGLMNGEDFDNRSTGSIYSPITGLRTAKTSPSSASQKLKVALKTTEIRIPGNKHVFVEEDVSVKNPAQYFNAGGFVLLYRGNYTWWDWPAYYHNDSGTIGFADGHAERHKWQESKTLALIKGEIGISDFTDQDIADSEDLRWMVSGYIPMP